MLTTIFRALEAYTHNIIIFCLALEKDGFDSENPLFKCHVAVCDNKIIGYALYFYIYSTLNKKIMHLEDLYVTPEYRQKYVGSRLFDAIAKV
jgi:GNAT superfamily N-acetyltransferase